MLRKEGTKTKKYRVLNTTAYTAMATLLFLVFLSIGLLSDSWENSYNYRWGDIESSSYIQYDFDRDNRGLSNITAYPNMISLGNVDENNYPLLVMHDSFEGNAFDLYFNQSDIYQFLMEPNYIRKMNSLYNSYGKGMLGTFSVGKIEGEDRPDFLFQDLEKNREIRTVCVIPDINGDSINDLFVCYGITPQLPNVGEGYEYNSYQDYFYPTDSSNNQTIFDINRFNDYFDYVRSSLGSHSLAVISSKTDFYRCEFISGDGYWGQESDLPKGSSTKSKQTLNITSSADFRSDNVIHAEFFLNRTVPSSDGTLVLFNSNCSKAAYYGNHWSKATLTHEMGGYNLEGKKIWEKDLDSFGNWRFTIPRQFLNNTMVTQTDGDCVFDIADCDVPLTINNYNGYLVLSYLTSGYRTITGSFESFTSRVKLNFIFNATSGEYLWGTFGDLISNQIPWHAQVNLEIDTNSIYFSRVEASRINSLGETDIISLDKYNLTSALIQAKTNIVFPTFGKFDAILSMDNAISNDSIPEVVVVSYNNRSSSLYRINLRSDGSQIINRNLSLFEYRNPENIQLSPMFVDIDRDHVNDYFLDTGSRFMLISGLGNELFNRTFESVTTNAKIAPMYGENYADNEADLFVYRDHLYFFHDPIDNLRVSAVLIMPNQIQYFEDVNSYTTARDFISFFAPMSYYLVGGILVVACLCILLMVKNIKYLPEKLPDRSPSLTRQVKMTFILLLGIYFIIFYYFIQTDLSPRYTDIYISENASIYWFFIVYPMVFILFTLIPAIYNRAAPIFADKLYLRLQKLFYSFHIKMKKKDYTVLVLHQDERKKVKEVSYIRRSILPLLIGLTIGISVYNGLADGGSILTFLQKFFPDMPALTNPSNLGIWTDDMTTIDLIWVELGKYARYMVAGMLISYIFSALIIAPAWLLDDAGCVYYIRAKTVRSVNDIDSVSSWFLKFVSGAFGITAIVSWATLFLPFLQQLDTLYTKIEKYTSLNPAMTLLVIVIALVFFPIVATIALMTTANQKMEQRLVFNSNILFERMQKLDIDVIPRNIDAIFDAKDKTHPGPWTDYFDKNLNPIIPKTKEISPINKGVSK